MTKENSGLRAFTTYSGNVKERINELPLGPLTAIAGEEATYKSTIAIGIRLALTGAYEAVGKAPSDLLTLAADPQVGIEATLSGPDGVAYWRLRVDPETSKAKKPDSPQFEGRINELSDDERAKIIPTDSVRELLRDARGERKLREKFISRFGGSLRDIPEPVAMDEDERETWTLAIADCRAGLEEGASADTLLAKLSEYFRKESGAKRREITPISNFVAQKKAWLAQQENEEGLSPELLEETEATLRRARAYEQAEGDRKLKAEAEAELVAIQAEVTSLSEEAKKRDLEAEAKAESLKDGVVAAEASRNKALAVLLEAGKKVAAYEVLSEAYARAIVNGAQKCQFCPHEFKDQEPLIVTKALFDAKTTKLREAEKAAQTVYEEADKALLVAQSAVTDHDRTRWVMANVTEKKHDQVRRRFAETSAAIKTREAALAKAPSKYNGPKADELQRKVDILKAAVEARATLTREGAKLRKMEKEHAMLKKLEMEAVEIQKQVMTRVAKKASEEVSRGMLDGRRARLDPHTCEWYVIRKDGKEFGPFGTLCGTEKTSLLLGLVAAWTRGSPLRVAIFDDEDMVGLSSKGITDFYRQCEELYERGDFTQVVLVSNRPDLVPSKERGGRWHTILRSPRALSPDAASV